MADLKKILIIDNDLVIRYTLKKIFSNFLTPRIKIFTSSDGLQGLGYVYVVRPDLIIIDTTLPKYSGRELMEYITTNPTLKDTPVILLNEGEGKFDNIPDNYVQVSKNDSEFPNNLINETVKVLDRGLDLSLDENNSKVPFNSTQYKITNFLSKKILRYSNISDVESQKVLSKNVFIKSLYYIKYLFDQFLTSVYLTNFYIFVGKKDYEETVDQKTQDVERFRVKTFPALAFGLALIFFGIIQVLMLSGVFVALTYVATAPAYAASYTWDGGGADSNWSTCANWSSDICPTAADSVTFDSTSTKASTIDASFGGSLTSITVTTGYSGTITAARSLTLSLNYTQSTGTVNFGAQALTTANFTMTGGTFTAPSTTMTWGNNVSISAGTFNNNGGTVLLNGGSAAISSCTGVTFNLVQFYTGGGTGSKTIGSNCTFPLGNNPTIPNGFLLNGTITGTGTLTGTTGTLSFGSTGSMSGFTAIGGGAGINVTGGTWNFSSLTISIGGSIGVSLGTVTLPNNTAMGTSLLMTGGTLNAPSGNMTIGVNISFSGGTFNHNNGTITLNGSTATIACNNATFNSVIINGVSNGVKTINSDCTLPLGNNPTVTNPITLNGTLSGTGTLAFNYPAGTNTVNAGGTFSGFTGMTNTLSMTFAGSTSNFGSYTTFSAAAGTLTLSSGTLTLPNNTDLNGALTISGGTFNAPSGTMSVAGNLTISGSPTFNANSGTVAFDGSTATLSCNNVTFSSVSINGNSSGVKTVNSNCNLPLGNNPTIAAPITLSGTLTGTGLLTVLPPCCTVTMILNSGFTLSGFNGLNVPFLTINNATADFGSYTTFVASGTVNMAAGTLTLPSGADLNGSLTLSGGTFNAPSGNMTLASTVTISGSTVFNANGGTVTFDGIATNPTIACNNVTFSKVVIDETPSSTTGLKTFNSDCNLPLGNNPTINAPVIMNGTLSGSGTLTVNSVRASDVLTLNTGSALSGFSGLVINDSGSAFKIAGATINLSAYTTFSITGGFTITGGTFTAPSALPFSISGAYTQSGGTFNSSNVSFSATTNAYSQTGGTFNQNNGTMYVNGNFTINNAGAVFNGGSGAIDTNGSFSLTSGSFTSTSSTFNVGVGFTISSGTTFNNHGGTIIFDESSTGTIACNNATFNLVAFNNNAGTKTVNSDCNLPLGNNPTLSSGSGSITSSGVFSGTGTITTPLGSLILQNGASLSGFTGIVGRGVITTVATTASTHLNLASYTTADFNGNLNINAATNPFTNTFTAPTGTLYLAADLVFGNGIIYNSSNGSTVIDGTGAGFIQCNGKTINNIQIVNTAGDKYVYPNCSFVLGNNPIIGATGSTGRFIIYGGSITGTGKLTSNEDFVIGGASSLTSASGFTEFDFKKLLELGHTTANFSDINKVSVGTLNVYGAPASFTAPQNLYISLDTSFWTSGGYHHNNGKVILNGTNQTFIVGTNNPFYDLEKINTTASTLLIPATSSYSITVSHNLTLKGAAGNLLSLRSGTPGSQWNINATNTDIAYLDVKDSNNVGASVVQAGSKNITDSGNNTRWNFDNPAVSAVGPIFLTNGSNISNNKPGYTFTLSDPQVSDTVKYQIQIDNNSNFSSPEIDYSSALQTQGAATFTVGQEAGGGVYVAGSANQPLGDGIYFVRIKGLDGTGGDGGYATINGTNSAFTVDTIKPTGSVIYAYKTDSTSREIYLIMSATDNLSGVDKMMISENSNFANATFEEYKTSKAYTVSDGYGTKTVYVKFRDRAGNESVSYIVNPSYTQVIVTPSTTPVVTQVPVSYGVPISNNGSLTDGLSVVALRLVGSTNSPLSNVSINIPQLGISTKTDENGLVVLENVPLGSYEVLGLFNNKEFNQSVEISPDKSVITIKLQDSPNILTVVFALVSIILLIIIVIFVIFYLRRKDRNDSRLSI